MIRAAALFVRLRGVIVIASAITTVLIPAAARSQDLNYRWTLIEIGDCPGRDVSESQPTATPELAMCNHENVGKTAVCWDGIKTRHSNGRVWCTYKNVGSQQCTGGSNPGYKYACGGYPR